MLSSRFFLLLFLIMMAGVLHGQWRPAPAGPDSSALHEAARTPSLPGELESTPSLQWWEKSLAVLGASLFFAGFDYAGYNATRSNPTALKVYRVTQVLTQLGISWTLYEYAGLGPAIGFNMIWWTFGDDFLYYGYAEVINPGHPWESRGDYRHGVGGNQCTWAYWTPVGIARGMKRNEKIPERTLIAQSLLGAALGLAVSIAF